MSLRTHEEQWAVWMVQARNFAKRENFSDAVARMRVVKKSIEEVLSDERDPVLRGRVQRQLARAEEVLGDLESRAEAWRSAIGARRQQTIDGAEEEMARPLPLAADER